MFKQGVYILENEVSSGYRCTVPSADVITELTKDRTRPERNIALADVDGLPGCGSTVIGMLVLVALSITGAEVVLLLAVPAGVLAEVPVEVLVEGPLEVPFGTTVIDGSKKQSYTNPFPDCLSNGSIWSPDNSVGCVSFVLPGKPPFKRRT